MRLSPRTRLAVALVAAVSILLSTANLMFGAHRGTDLAAVVGIVSGLVVIGLYLSGGGR